MGKWGELVVKKSRLTVVAIDFVKARAQLAVLCLLFSSALPGCASHTLYNGIYEGSGPSGEEFSRAHTSVLGDAGLESQSSGMVARECGEEGLAKVAVRRSFGQTLLTIITLGAINPATISYQCQVGGADDPTPGDEAEF